MAAPNQNPKQVARDNIDRMLEVAGWHVQQTKKIDFNAGVGVAVREFQTDVGPADYALFVDRKAIGVIEAKPADWGHKITTVEEQSAGYAASKLKMEADASRYHGKAPDEIDWSAPERQTRAVAEFLTAIDDDDPNADRKLPKVISPVDPCSAWTAKANKRVQFGYGLNYLIDIENAVIVDVEATPARTYDEVAATKVMIKRTDERLGFKPKRLAADTAYGTGKFLGWLLETGITPHIPVWDKSARKDGTFSRADFTFDKDRNVYVCPEGKLLTSTGRVHDGRTILYRTSTRDCGSCPIKSKCTPNMTFRKIPRDVHEDARDQARALMGTPEFDKSRDERKKVEMRFAHLKTHHRFERMRLRGLSGARDEFHLAATVQNLKTLANYIWRPPQNLPAPCPA